MLLIYSLLGFSTLGRFVEQTPDIAPSWMATIVTDTLAGIAVASFAVYSALSTQPTSAGSAGR